MNTKNFSIKRIILLSLTALISAFNILTLLFTIVDINVSAFGTYLNASVNGFSVMDKYPAAIEDCGAWLGIYSIIHIIFAVIILFAATLSFFKKEWEEFIGLAKITNVISCILAFVYMINGTIAVSEAESSGSSFYKVTTAAFVPLIFIVIFTASFFAVKALMNDSFSFKKAEKKAEQSTAVNAADELLKYKNLLDQNAITEEEYEKKKNQLLNL